MRRLQRWLAALMMVAGMVLSATSAVMAGRANAASSTEAVAPLPQRLSETGLYVAGSVGTVSPNNIPFSPQYPLWSDGAAKRRWLFIPSGTAIDASNPNAWEFPRGTRLWKEFSLGRRIETRLIERLADGTWRFATYVWDEDGRDATLAPVSGVRALPVASAPKGRYTIPSEADCRACHDGAASPVLGVGTLQLSADRDPLAPNRDVEAANSADLRALVDRGWLRNLPGRFLIQPPRIAARSERERAVLGYLHGNCGHCHNASEAGGGVPVSLNLAHDVADSKASVEDVLRVLAGPSRFKQNGAAASRIVVPGAAEASLLALRMRSRHAQTQMPPLGTDVVDAEALSLIERWINIDLAKEP